MFNYKYKMPAVTADIIPFRKKENGELEILLIKRNTEPFKDHWAFVGGHLDVDDDNSIYACAARELFEETGIRNKYGLFFLDWFDAKDRDPRGRYITFVWGVRVHPDVVAKAGDDAEDCKWFRLKNLLENDFIKLAFDHRKILEKCSNQMACESIERQGSRWADEQMSKLAETLDNWDIGNDTKTEAQ
ncbi:MAG: NUDIX hydrolase [Crenarchaeota archaeon]|nr:MAG: NUDIX hydrolase [Thermoproteota archaeon]